MEEIVIGDNFSKIIPQILVTNESEIEDFQENSINSGCEGLMLKSLEAKYRAGARGLSEGRPSTGQHEIPWDEIAFAVVKETLQRYFKDRTRGVYSLQVGDIRPR